ncbi:MAG: class I SAM-dependent methyltransferase [Mariprofundales bacterium]
MTQEFRPHFFPGRDQLREARSNFLRFFSPADRVLDLGCARGEVLQLMKERGIEAVGVDSDPDMVDDCKQQGLAVHLSDIIAFLDTQNREWNGVFIGHVIEHLTTDQAHAMLRSVSKILKPGGRVIVLTPNPNWLPGIGEFWSDPTHVRFWPISAVTSMLKDLDIRVIASGVDPATMLQPQWSNPVLAMIDCLRLLLLKLIVLQQYNGGEIYIVGERIEP